MHILQRIYAKLLGYFGPQNWWPAESPFEVVVGAILTQNTNWGNVEKAIGQLKAAEALDIAAIDRLPAPELERLIRPAGFFRQKAARLKNFTRFLHEAHGGQLDDLFTLADERLRQTLLARPGIGPETADSILLYAAGRPSFVVDAYTQRILGRIGLQAEGTPYERTRAFFMRNLPRDAGLFNEYHALLVRLAKTCCRKRNPACADCPLRALCATGRFAGED